ncbi:class I SAM-dependent methyltransferase [Chelativorans sp. AA-79]|uniref:class I SAM-dependent methyltransferase n=1 Tax=Chelativorans sp. AA-79 TaxID=3028735 RepID=UPI0023F94E0F|nr:class I SAM-dependent methyltransferase [Chelativorans sp. AA-79]WEX07709.1 class I SAM-dependent methyltransferase [Chelativorans sp. AA-79]
MSTSAGITVLFKRKRNSTCAGMHRLGYNCASRGRIAVCAKTGLCTRPTPILSICRGENFVMQNERESVVNREREFHNIRFGQEEDPRKYLDKWYRTIRHGAERQDEEIIRRSKDADVLEYGCSDGGWSLYSLRLPDICRSLTGIDISDVAVAKANERARELGNANAAFFAMNAEDMSFEDNRFDLVYGRGIIHHLDLDRCFSDVARVLKPNGVASFYEPMGHNPLLNAYRRRTPDIRTVDEHPLLVSDFALARRYFSGVRVDYFGLCSVGSALAPPGMSEVVYSAGKAVDSVVLAIPFVKRFAWYALLTLRV